VRRMIANSNVKRKKRQKKKRRKKRAKKAARQAVLEGQADHGGKVGPGTADDYSSIISSSIAVAAVVMIAPCSKIRKYNYVEINCHRYRRSRRPHH
jgi:hypothetical protein